MEFLRQILKLFWLEKYTKTTLKLFRGMSNSKLPTNFQLIIFIFEGKPSNFISVIEAKC